MKIGLRIDVDTYRGTKIGIPNLCRLFEKHKIKGSFFLSVGPDNMGRHLWRLLKPVFLWKMLRTNAAGLYGPEIILMGTCWPGPRIGKRLGAYLKTVADAGHEIGFHAWDHHREQSKIDRMSSSDIFTVIRQGCEIIAEVTGGYPVCSAVPGWRCNDSVLLEKSKFPFRFNSDCRGDSVFRPVVGGKMLEQIQIPVTLPTYDEAVGRNGISDANYNDYMISLLRPQELNVLTIHAEAEGGKCLSMFDEFILRVKEKGGEFVPLGNLLDGLAPADIPPGKIIQLPFPGREGLLACQEKT